jgi:hypothetical protein
MRPCLSEAQQVDFTVVVEADFTVTAVALIAAGEGELGNATP